MKIFITGSTGFIGQNLVQYYASRGHDVFEHNRFQELPLALTIFEPDIIINCAAEIYDPQTMYTPNIVYVQHCLEYVESAAQHVRMVQIGSSAEYGPTDFATNEETLLKPVDFYQGTKAAATLMCQGWARQFNLPIWIARPYSVYGPGERPHRLFPKLFMAFTRDEPMTLYQGYHDFIYINDFVQGINSMLFDWDIAPGEIINFGSGQQISNFDLLTTWELITNKTAPVAKVAELKKTFENNVWVCDTSKATNLGFTCSYTLENGIRDFINKAEY